MSLFPEVSVSPGRVHFRHIEKVPRYVMVGTFGDVMLLPDPGPPVCETTWPNPWCSCGRFLLRWSIGI